ncbi:cell division cycle-associated protein 4 [Electrophorus electricus]|uniref:SERTA domain-containing protein n=1 Tax=Electrophorus electricus TaxID=8005 RepID=A0A4W4FD43_ELEEL|nr:cell division cycle-associated protein 4 [Electrophorus electricus]
MGQRDVVPLETSMKRRQGIHPTSMCRLDVDSAVTVLKKEVESGEGDALSSSRYVLGRGVKRKVSDCEDPTLGLPYPQQRQLVLDLCLDKLQSCQQRAEPSLHRSVLLANTLRQIQQEMRLEGGTCLPPAPSAPSLLHAPTPRHLPEMPPASLDVTPLLPGELSFSSLIPGANGEAQIACAESKPLYPLPSAEVNVRPSDSLFGSFEMMNSTSYLTDLALDDIFEDIDTSMYDPSDISVLAVPAPRGSGTAPGIGDDGLKNCSSCTPSSPLQLCLSDLSDLDHIMEILVHS